MRILEGNVVAEGIKIGIVAARFNEFIVSKLVGGAQDACVRHGVKDEDIDLAWVPGAFEIPIVAKKMAASGKFKDPGLCCNYSIEPTLNGGFQFTLYRDRCCIEAILEQAAAFGAELAVGLSQEWET